MSSAELTESEVQEFDLRDGSRLVCHISGDDVGHLRLDVEMPAGARPPTGEHSLELVLPGERSPLSPTSMKAKADRLTAWFFSSDIANSGHTPAQAVVLWMDENRQTKSRPVRVVSAKRAAADETSPVAPVQGAASSGAYPRTVSTAAIVAVAVTMLATIILLLIGE